MNDNRWNSTRFKELMAEFNASPTDISKLTDIPLDRVKQLSKGLVKPDVEELMNIADYFCVSLDYLCGKSDARLNPNFNPNWEERFLLDVTEAYTEIYPLSEKAKYIIHRVIGDCYTRKQQVVWLTYARGLTIPEVANILKIKEERVKATLGSIRAPFAYYEPRNELLLGFNRHRSNEEFEELLVTRHKLLEIQSEIKSIEASLAAAPERFVEIITGKKYPLREE